MICIGLEQYNSEKSKCQEFFDVYKECKKKEVSNKVPIILVLGFLIMCDLVDLFLHFLY